MSRTAKTRGVILWIDDEVALDLKRERHPLSVERGNGLWQRLFTDRTSRLYCLMDLQLHVVGSYAEAVAALERWTGPEAADAHVFAICDLGIPESDGGVSSTKYGIEVATCLRRAGIPFAFLSAAAEGGVEVNEAHLDRVPYFRKSRDDRLRLPDLLAARILREFSRNINWLSLHGVSELMHAASSFRGRAATSYAYPYFGVYQEFVDRWDARALADIPRICALRAGTADSDQVVEHAVVISHAECFFSQPGKVRLIYARQMIADSLSGLAAQDIIEDAAVIAAIRLDLAPERDALNSLIGAAQRRTGRTVLIVPDDERFDVFAEVLSESAISILDEAPALTSGQAAEREELVLRCAELTLTWWSEEKSSLFRDDKQYALHVGWLTLPQLLIHPVNWVALLESTNVSDDISDHVEILEHFTRAMSELSPEDTETLLDCAMSNLPIPPGAFFRVRSRALEASSARAAQHVRSALEQWLKQSWSFPYGAGQRFADLSRTNSRNGLAELRTEAWEDHCYEVLCMLAKHYVVCERDLDVDDETREPLSRVCRFLNRLGHEAFVEPGVDTVDWESLESLRWPHHLYPMPAAVNRRLQAANRYLWIQPSSLDLAAALPAGRLRYRGLGQLSEMYGRTLDWLEQVLPQCPLGWRETLTYLVHVIRSHEAEEQWTSKRVEFWGHLLGLLRNGAPTMLLGDRILRGVPATGDAAGKLKQVVLSELQQFGPLLSELRRNRNERLKYITLRGAAASDIAGTSDALFGMRLVASASSDSGHEPGSDVAADLLALLEAFANATASDQSDAAAKAVEVLRLDSGRQVGNSPWFRKEFSKQGLESVVGHGPRARLTTLAGTRLDYLWQLLDSATHLNFATYSLRYYDGYHLLSALGDLRNLNKETIPNVPTATIGTVLDLFLAGMPGVLAHLAVCLDASGHAERAQTLIAPWLDVSLPSHPAVADLGEVLQVEQLASGYCVAHKGIPGGLSVDLMSFHRNGVVEHLGAG